MKKRKIVLLDLGGVVFQSTGVSNLRIQWEIINQLNRKYSFGLNIGQDLFPEFLTEYNQITRQHLEGKVFLKEVFDTLEFNQPLIDLLSQHYDIVIVSDNYRENIEYISKRYHFANWSLRQFYSFDFQMEKSNPDFFKKLITELSEYEVNDMLFIDDSLKKLERAAQSGIKGILFQNNLQVEKELSAFYGNL